MLSSFVVSRAFGAGLVGKMLHQDFMVYHCARLVGPREAHHTLGSDLLGWCCIVRIQFCPFGFGVCLIPKMCLFCDIRCSLHDDCIDLGFVIVSVHTTAFFDLNAATKGL